MNRVLVIAEGGVNHNGKLDLGLRLVDAAVAAGADIVKFQSFRADTLATANAPKAAYQVETTGDGQSQWEMLKRLEMDDAMHRALKAHADSCGIEFLSTPFDEEGIGYLSSLGVRRLKLPSGELTNGPFVLRAARANLPIIVSTGMATMAEVGDALGVIAFGLTAPAEAHPARAAFAAALASPEGRAALRAQVTVLHCTTQYPAPPESANLRAMDSIAARFDVPVGYSDHTMGIGVAIAAAARGATVIEKHLTLDRSMPGPDHRASLEPDTFGAMVEGIRAAEAAFGDGIKAPHPVEVPNIAIARKSLVASRAIPAGQPIGPGDLTAKRPGDGRSPMDYWDVLGTPAPRAFAKDEKL
ncbi:MAG: N-acetylneuraminate synthase [Proteobacteria bacterium]|nr:N-acetylneuraminate synthase [Pseudomonadota bacterium]